MAVSDEVKAKVEEKRKKFNEIYNNLNVVRANTSKSERLAQLAEEASELSQAALKMIRTFRFSTNPADISYEEAEKQLVEEYTDVVNAAKSLFLNYDLDILVDKADRWAKRVENVNHDQED